MSRILVTQSPCITILGIDEQNTKGFKQAFETGEVAFAVFSKEEADEASHCRAQPSPRSCEQKK